MRKFIAVMILIMITLFIMSSLVHMAYDVLENISKISFKYPTQ